MMQLHACMHVANGSAWSSIDSPAGSDVRTYVLPKESCPTTVISLIKMNRSWTGAVDEPAVSSSIGLYQQVI